MQSPLQLIRELDFSGFQAANHCHKNAKLDLLEIAFEIVSSQIYANFNYQEVTDGNKSAFQFLFSFYCHFSYARTWELVNLFVGTKHFTYHICYENSSKT